MKAAERHRLKEDKYADTVMSAAQWVKAHQSKVIAVAAAVVIVAAAVVWTLYSRMQAQQEAQKELSEYETAADGVLGLKAEARAEAVKNALSNLDSLVTAYPDSEVASQALLRAAELLTATGEPAKAAGYFERLVQMTGAPEGMRALARRGWAACLEQSGDVAKAIVQYKALAAAGTPQEAVEADWDVGRCYEMLKDPENAKSFYRKAIESGGESKWAELARFRIESLDRGPMSAESVPFAPAAIGAAPAATASAPETTASMPAAPSSASATTSPEPEKSAPATTAPAEAATSPEPAENAAPK